MRPLLPEAVDDVVQGMSLDLGVHLRDAVWIFRRAVFAASRPCRTRPDSEKPGPDVRFRSAGGHGDRLVCGLSSSDSRPGSSAGRRLSTELEDLSTCRCCRKTSCLRATAVCVRSSSESPFGRSAVSRPRRGGAARDRPRGRSPDLAARCHDGAAPPATNAATALAACGHDKVESLVSAPRLD